MSADTRALPAALQVGMRYFNKRTNKYFNPIVNLDKLWALVGEEVRLLPTVSFDL